MWTCVITASFSKPSRGSGGVDHRRQKPFQHAREMLVDGEACAKLPSFRLSGWRIRGPESVTPLFTILGKGDNRTGGSGRGGGRGAHSPSRVSWSQNASGR